MAQNFTPKPKQRHMYLLDLCEFKSSLDYRASFLVNWGYIMRPCFQTNTKNTEAKLNRKKKCRAHLHLNILCPCPLPS